MEKPNEMEIKIEQLRELLGNAYSPYSKFQVACIVVTKDGKEYKGVNIENSSYGATVCAERVAIFSAVTDGKRCGDFDKVYCMNSSGNIGKSCGICLQVISEFFSLDSELINIDTSGEYKIRKLKDLLPELFVLNTNKV